MKFTQDKVSCLKAKPLEVKKRQIEYWETSNYDCIALIGSEKGVLEEHIKKLYIEAMKNFGKAFAVVWFFDNGISQEFYLEQFDLFKLKLQRNDCVICELSNYEDIERFICLWGEFDSLDIIFPISIEEYCNDIKEGFYNNYNKYRRDYLSWIKKTRLVISDSGDGDEVQVVYLKTFTMK